MSLLYLKIHFHLMLSLNLTFDVFIEKQLLRFFIILNI